MHMKYSLFCYKRFSHRVSNVLQIYAINENGAGEWSEEVLVGK